MGKIVWQNMMLLLMLLPEGCNFIKKRLWPQVFSREFSEISKNIFFTEYFRVTASGTLSDLSGLLQRQISENLFFEKLHNSSKSRLKLLFVSCI